jgi:hypothetical protein
MAFRAAIRDAVIVRTPFGDGFDSRGIILDCTAEIKEARHST